MVDAQLFARWLGRAHRRNLVYSVGSRAAALRRCRRGACVDLVASGRADADVCAHQEPSHGPRVPDGAHVLQTARAVRTVRLRRRSELSTRTAKSFAMGSGGAYFIEGMRTKLQSLVARFAEKHLRVRCLCAPRTWLAWMSQGPSRDAGARTACFGASVGRVGIPPSSLEPHCGARCASAAPWASRQIASMRAARRHFAR